MRKRWQVSLALLLLLLPLGSSRASVGSSDTPVRGSFVPEELSMQECSAPMKHDGITVAEVLHNGLFHIYGIRDRLGTAATITLFLLAVSFLVAVLTAKVFRLAGMLIVVLLVMSTRPTRQNELRGDVALGAIQLFLSCVGGTLCYILCWGLPNEWIYFVLYLVYFVAIMRTTTSVVIGGARTTSS